MSEADKLEQEAVTHGRDAWARLKKDQTFEDWLLVGQALDIGRGWARRRANAPSGRGFNEAFSGWLSDNGFADIDKGTRSRLADIIEHRAEIEAWRQQLPLPVRLRRNHPNSIWRGWESDKKKDGLPTIAEERKATSAPRKPSPASEIVAATDRLHQTLDAVEERLGPDLIGLFDLSPEHVETSADNFIDIFGEEAVRRFFAVLQQRLAPVPKSEKPIDPAFVKSLGKNTKHFQHADDGSLACGGSFHQVSAITRKWHEVTCKKCLRSQSNPNRGQARGLKTLDDPSRPRNRTKFKSGVTIQTRDLGELEDELAKLR